MKKHIKWKDFFYFQKNEKVAVILLFILVLLSGTAYFLSGLWNKDSEYDEDKIALAEFDEFQRNLKPIYRNNKSSDSEDTEEKEKGTKSARTKINREKLNEGQTIDLNSADLNTLKRVPGIGDAFAKRIISYRENLGGFIYTEQLMEVQGFSKKKYESVASFFAIKKKHRKLKINKLTLDQLCKHPYISESTGQAIIQKRADGKIKSMEELSAIVKLKTKEIERLTDYLSFD